MHQSLNGWIRVLGLVAAVTTILRFNRDFRRLRW